MKAVRKIDDDKEITRAPRIGNLRRVEDVLREARRVYRLSRAGELETADMSRYIAALFTMVSIMRTSDLETRIEQLEASQNART